MFKKLWGHICSLWRRLLELRDTPHAIAGGVAIGMFYGFTPLFMLKTLLSLATAWLARCSKIAAVLAVCLHDVIAPLWPVLLGIEYEIGFWLMSNPHRLAPMEKIHDIRLSQFFHWTTFHKYGLPMLVGSMVIAVPAAILSYFIAYAIASKRPTHPLKPGS
ncbi:MAG: DUF2062 domain-containing protein [Chthoniobacterales bacterium]